MLGYMLFMFLAGVKLDMGMIRKTGSKAFAVGILALVGPLGAGMAFVLVTYSFSSPKKNLMDLSLITASHSLTPFPVIVCFLSELKILTTELGRLALSSAIVSDLLSIIVTNISTTAYNIDSGSSGIPGWVDGVSIAAFVVAVVYILRPAMLWVVAGTPAGGTVNHVYIFAVIAGIFLCGVLSDLLEQSVLFGAFIFGLAVPDGPPLGSALVEKLEPMVSAILMPIFMATCAMRVDLKALVHGPCLTCNVVIILVTIIGKIVACLVPALYCRMPLNDALALGLIMTAKGSVNLATQSLLWDNEVSKSASKIFPLSSGLILLSTSMKIRRPSVFSVYLVQIATDQSFAVMVMAIALNAAVVHLLVKKLYDPSRKYAGYQTRTIVHCKPSAELRILACVHEQEGITSIISLLSASNRSRDNPICIFVLHLIELVGRATPVFISHDLQKRTVSNQSYSENIIHALNRYERDNGGAPMAHVFTVISPSKLMHDDICGLALNKLAFFLIVPFHRKWNVGGSIESEEQRIRNLNRSVLNMAPCSVGILVDRGQLGRSNLQSFYIAIIFLGGNDDRECLAYAKRMASGPNVNLTVVHFLPADDENTNEWENILDDEALKDIKHVDMGFEQVNYLQKVVKDGPQTALIVRSLATQFDLVIVGRRHDIVSPVTSGLSEWSEFPELGALGDLLASSDLDSNASVLVVQHQRKL